MWDLTRMRFTCNSRKLFKTYFWWYDYHHRLNSLLNSLKGFFLFLLQWLFLVEKNHQNTSLGLGNPGLFKWWAARPLDWALFRQGPMPDAMTPRSKDVTPLDFFLWGSVKDSVYVLPLPQSIEELKDRISAAIETISADLLDKVHTCLSKRHLLRV